MTVKKITRQFIVLLTLFFVSGYIYGQNWDELPWKSYADHRLQPLNKTYVTTGILYDRVFPIANIDEYTGSLSFIDTTHQDHFIQAYYEIYNSAFNTSGWKSPEQLDSSIKYNGSYTQHPIGVFLYKFNSLDTNAFQDNLIDTLANGQFVDVSGRPRSPYFTHTSFIATPLLAEDQVIEQGIHEFYMDPQFFVQNENFTISQIRIDFGDGQGEWVVDNPFGPYGGGALQGGPYVGEGLHEIPQNGGGLQGNFISSIVKSLTVTILGRITVVGHDILGNARQYGNPFKIFVKKTKQYDPLTTCKGLQKWVIDPDPTALAVVNAQYGNPQLEYKNKDGNPAKDTAYFYFAGNGSSCNSGILRRPIVFIDGFDPTNDRTVQKIYEDYINVRVSRNGDPNTLFGDYMLQQGYDFVILDFKHGNDLLERNAMTLVALLQRLNQTYGSTYLQDITLIGPSMGSLIAQYALAYMETNIITHRVKTYISFDGCHQGANVPIGLQNYVEYFTKRGIFKKTESIRQGLYNGLAAKQMLAHHASANSAFPAPDALRTQFLQNLSAVGEYPALCRKVALINGAKTGVLNPSQDASSTLIRISTKKKGWKSIWGLCGDKICMKLDWECKTAPNNGTQKVTDMWTVEPLFNLLFWVPPGRKSHYAQAAWGNSAQDDAPGGTFGTFFGSNPGDVDESKFVFLLKEFMYLLTGSKRTDFYQNINEFTMMPSYSAADLRFPNKNLYMNWSNEYLCGKTPFDFVYAPSINETHVRVTENGSQWFENEVRCNPADLPTYITPGITGNDLLCTSEVYSIQTCKPGINVQWSASPASYVSISGTGSQVTISKVYSGNVTLTATVASCNSSFTQTFTKLIKTGGFNSSDYPVSGPSFACQNQTLYFSTNELPGATNYAWFWPSDWTYQSGQGTRWLTVSTSYGSYSGAVGVRVANACDAGGSPGIKYVQVSSCGFFYSASPNPSTGDVTISTVQPGVAATKQNPNKIYKIKVVDQTGNIQKQYVYTNGITNTNISLRNLIAGIYTIQAYNGTEWSNQQIMKK